MSIAIQRLEGGALAIAALVAVIALQPAWWWMPLAAFLLFDLSALGYLRSPAVGAVTYNVIHTYAWPAAGVVLAVLTAGVAPVVSAVATIVAGSWAFHIGVDRALGYGLKLPDAFQHTHLGWIGRGAKA